MKLRCPHCGHAAGIIDFANEEAARQAVYLAADLPKPLGKQVMRYVGLFRPAQRSLSWDRTLKLMRPLAADIDAGRIERHGRIWPAPEAAWHHAFAAVLEKADTGTLKLPLKNHGYLYEIIASQQNSVEAQAEQQKEEQRQQAQHRRPKSKPEQTQVDKQAGAQALSQAFKQLGKHNPAHQAIKVSRGTDHE